MRAFRTKRTMRTVIAAAAVLSVSAGLVGCSNDTNGGDSGEFTTEGKSIGQILYSSNESQMAHARHVEEYAASLGMDVRTVDGQIDPQVQTEAVSDFVSANLDGILLQPVDPAAAVVPIEQAQQANIPIATWAIKPADEVTTPFLELNEYDTTFEAGVNAANAIAEHFPGAQARVVVLDIPTVPLCSELRVQGFVDGVLSVAKDGEVVARLDGVGDRESSTNVMEDLLQTGADFNIVSACNGEMLLGALGALRAAGRGEAVDNVPVTEYLFSIDGTSAEIEELMDPTSPVVETMALAPRENARAFVDILVKMMAGEIGMTEAYLEKTGAAGSRLLGPDCTVINQFMSEQYFVDNAVSC